MTEIFRFLKHLPNEVSYINSLFVSAFIRHNGLRLDMYNFLSKYVLSNSDTLESFLKVVEDSGSFNLEQLVQLFEFVISPSDRIVNGAIYTPNTIRNSIIVQCMDHFSNEQLKDIKVCDISCGCGGFLMNVAEYIHARTGKSFKDIYKDNIFGIDIQTYSVERTKILLSLLAIQHGENRNFKFNLLIADTLEYHSENWDQAFTSFDVIVGNPPYVCSRHVNDETKKKMLQYEVSHSGHPDLYIPFFQIADEMLKDGGVLGYITMNSFIRSLNGRRLRKYFSSRKKAISIVDFRGHQIFIKKSTYTCLFFLNKGLSSNKVRYLANEKGILNLPFSYISIPYSLLDDQKGWNLNDNNTTMHIESVGVPIGQYCPSRHGLATLNNKTYIFKPISEDSTYYYFESEDKKYPVEKNICKDVVNSNKLNSTVCFDNLVEKIIYPYYLTEEGNVHIIDEITMQRNYPKAYFYLLSKRTILSERDKGNQSYPAWYAYGRTQSLQLPRYKLFFPKFANRSIRCVLCDNPELLLYNGLAFVSDTKLKLLIVQKVIESSIFWNYLVKNAKPYSSDYYSLSGNDIKNFGVPNFTKEEIHILLSFKSRKKIDEWLARFYK